MTTHTTSAFLWDGVQRLPGTLTLGDAELVFEVEGFANAALRYQVKYSDIAKVELSLLFDLELHGLTVEDTTGRRYFFVVEHPTLLRQNIQKHIKLNNNEK